ncbi:hypothetical protein [Amycolatopsis silviterrae]|uniref:PQQ-binding-like beta-propeller repeat protein n=1 Tax=Amycolatopsis silviterrae TaxID=1656914 RepID=A0ABW5H449_9PSEU
MVGSAVAVAGERLVLLDAATGVRRPTALQTSTGIRGVGALTTTFAVGEHSETESGEATDMVWGIDPHDGSKAWGTRLPRPMGDGLTAGEGRVLVPTMAAETKPPAGFLVLRESDGVLAWGETRGGTAEWLTCAMPRAIYAASSDTVYAYPNQS